MDFRVECQSIIETNQFAKKLAVMLKGGEVIQLIGDMGTGKTTFTKALVKALGSTDNVTSPTFTVCNRYHGKFTIYHCDFYRLSNDKLIEKELKELIDEKNIVIMEWAEKLTNPIKYDTLNIEINMLDENTREFLVHSGLKYKYLELI